MILKKKKHLFREKNEWAQSELQQRDIKYKKVPKESHNWTEKNTLEWFKNKWIK